MLNRKALEAEAASIIEYFAQGVRQSGNDQKAKQSAIDQSLSKFNFGEFRDAQNALTTAARSLLTRIMNVDEAARPSDAR